ncbi:phosphoribosylanthranilate isomerase [Limisalsivibrio acetivorans]|uniref:phosphoribosylanthranilate isomerase n=1 Tax=Limisalsivibrio acetivorans TaxID=1304888 RepID=UPI0003B306D5|nr:hypothetical protein [Limisalsivibrio acetivorans]
MFVKVCGVSDKETIDKAIELGYDAVGVVLYPPSKRYVPDAEAVKLAEHAKGRVSTFVVSVLYTEVMKVAGYFDYVQVFENAPVPNLVYATAEKPEGSKFQYLLYDASRGSGKFGEFPAWLTEYRERLIVAGGLNSVNVAKVINDLRPFGVDVSSGVEKGGKKDYDMMKDFIESVRDNDEF